MAHDHRAQNLESRGQLRPPTNTPRASGCFSRPTAASSTWGQPTEQASLAPTCLPEPHRSLAVTHPNLATQWHPTRNGEWTPRHVTAGRGRLTAALGNPWWLCPGCKTAYQARIIDRTHRQTGCRECGTAQGAAKRRRPLPGESFGERFGHLLPELDVEANPADLDPFAVRPGCADLVWWCCGECGDRYQATFARRSQKRSDGTHRGCGQCGNKARAECARRRNDLRAAPAAGESFGDLEPALLREWDHQLTDLRDRHGNPLGPFQVMRSARHYAWWTCPKGHSYRARISSRTGTKRTGCRSCAKTGLSRPQADLATALSEHFQVETLRMIANRISSTHPNWEVDIFLPEINLVVEYDGAFWHGPKSLRRRPMVEVDREKSQDIRQQGFHLIRVRQEPLSPLHDDDVTFPADASTAEITKIVMARIDQVLAGTDRAGRWSHDRNGADRSQLSEESQVSGDHSATSRRQPSSDEGERDAC